MGNLYLFFLLLARDVDQMMKPEMTSRTASRVVTMMDSEPLMAAMATRTTKRTLQKKHSFHKRHRDTVHMCAIHNQGQHP